MLDTFSARLHGELISDFPQDLYIPPDALEVYLDAFEGPLDLLLYLIRKHNLNILDIPMADLTKQYMTYVEKMQANKLELAAEYLLMSAMLIEIKSRMLLPKPATVEAEQDPRAELVRRLMEYEAIKLAAQNLDTIPQIGRDIFVAAACYEQISQLAPVMISMDDLMQAWAGLAKRASQFSHHKVGRAELSVREHMSMILRRLNIDPMLEFTALFAVEEGISKLVVCFLAILELAREGLIRLTQSSAYSPIYVEVRFAD